MLLSHRFQSSQKDPNTFGYLFIKTANGYLIYNNKFYLGLDFNNLDRTSAYYSDIISVDIANEGLVFWDCTDEFDDSPTTSTSTITTSLSDFVVALQVQQLFGADFGPFENSSATFVNFEIIKNGKVIITDACTANSWGNNEISISYPQLNDLRFYYAYKPEFVNIVVYTSSEIFSLLLPVELPSINTDNPFQCSHKDGRFWRIDSGG